jgi:hypothetical protein
MEAAVSQQIKALRLVAFAELKERDLDVLGAAAAAIG